MCSISAIFRIRTIKHVDGTRIAPWTGVFIGFFYIATISLKSIRYEHNNLFDLIKCMSHLSMN
jgi:hypothetical protein